MELCWVSHWVGLMSSVPANDNKKPINYRLLWILATAAILLQWIPSLSPASEIFSSSALLLTQQEAVPLPVVKQFGVVVGKQQTLRKGEDRSIIYSSVTGYLLPEILSLSGTLPESFPIHHHTTKVSTSMPLVMMSKPCRGDLGTNCGKEGAGYSCGCAAMCCSALLPISTTDLVSIISTQYRALRYVTVSTLDIVPSLRPPII
jgi:hypothetical protein